MPTVTAALAEYREAAAAERVAVVAVRTLAAAHRLADAVTELAAAVAPALIAYDAESDDWTEANEEQHGTPSVKDCERHSEHLEEAAHSFAHAVRALVEPAPTIPPADPHRADEERAERYEAHARALRERGAGLAAEEDEAAAHVLRQKIAAARAEVTAPNQPADPFRLPDVPLTSGEHLARLIEEEAERRGLTVSDFLNETDTDGTMPRLNAEASRLVTRRAEVTDPNTLATAWPDH